MFRRSIREQRERFYGNKNLNDIVYGNSRKAREPPVRISGDETITRTYTRKGSDICMRTRKKNESGILNQNLYGSNEGYTTRKNNDPVGGGYTYTNMAYPGASYNMGNVFREKYMGNLLQLMFECDGYFRYMNIEFVADSHFGHIVPVAFLSLWDILCTCSFLPTRRGVSKLKELSSQKLSTHEQEMVLSERLTQEASFHEMADFRVSGEEKSSLCEDPCNNQQQQARKLINKKKKN